MAFYRVRIQNKPTIYLYGERVSDAIEAAEAFGEPLDVVEATYLAPEDEVPATIAEKHARPRGTKRTQSELGDLQQRVLDHLQREPGQRVEEMNAVLGTTTEDLALPLKKLIDLGVVLAQGEKRATRYFPLLGTDTADNLAATYGFGKSSVLRWLRQGKIRGFVAGDVVFVHMSHPETHAYVLAYRERVAKMPFTPPAAKVKAEPADPGSITWGC